MVGQGDLCTFLRTHLEHEFAHYFGVTDKRYIDSVTERWLDDEGNSQRLYADISSLSGGDIPKDARVLDMACGCGTFVYYGLLQGLDVWGVDPEGWKHTFNRMKADVYGYPQEWKYRFIKGIGETLPFTDQTFDFVFSYQTLEHVQDVKRCLQEMLRVLRPGGAMFLRSPDYRSIFEGHYRLPWLPLFPRSLARLYLGMLGRPTVGLSTINYVTTPSIKRMLRNEKVRIIDLDRQNARDMFREGLRISRFREGGISQSLWFLYRGVVSLIRLIVAVTLIVVKET